MFGCGHNGSKTDLAKALLGRRMHGVRGNLGGSRESRAGGGVDVRIERTLERNWAGSTGFEHADINSAVCTAAKGGSRKGNNNSRPLGRRSGQEDTGHDQCESNVATPLQASHPMQELISD